MRLKVARKVHYESGPNMTPLVDVVMVLLIFLMLTGTFGAAEHFLVSNLPYTHTGTGALQPPPGTVFDEPLEIRVDCPQPGRWIARAGKIAVGDTASLTAQLQAMRRQFADAGIEPDRVQVVISPARAVRYEDLIGIYQAATDAQFSKIAFATSH